MEKKMVTGLTNNVIQNFEAYILITKYIGATLVMALGAIGVSIAQGKIAGKACDAIAQNPSVEKPIKSTFFIGMVFVETSAIYCLMIAIILLFM